MRAWMLGLGLLLSASAHADDLLVYAVVDGASHHFVGHAREQQLNSWQHTLGIEISKGQDFIEVEHYTDSYFCSADDVTVGRAYPLWGNGGASIGFAIGATLQSRCQDFPSPGNNGREQFLAPIGGAYAEIGSRLKLEAVFIPCIPAFRALRNDKPIIYIQLAIAL